MDYPVYQGPTFVGYMEEDDCRDILRKRLGRLVRNGNERKVILNRETSHAVRALCIRDAGGAAISSTQREELYSGSRKEHTDGPVTATITVVRRPGKTIGRDALGREIFGFLNWGENDRFPRHRFNPDKIPAPIYASEAAMHAARA
jgi:hypothetical protein